MNYTFISISFNKITEGDLEIEANIELSDPTLEDLSSAINNPNSINIARKKRGKI
jgi:hypothetical protein